MKKLMIAVLTMALSSALWADSTYAFTYQAALRDEHGNVIMKDGEVVRNHKVTIRLWNAPAGGECLWARTFNVMTDMNGVFNLAVSDNGGKISDQDKPSQATLASVLAKNQAGDVYIGLEVENSAGEIGPRQRLLAVPFAAVANDVRKISKDVEVGGQIKLPGEKSSVFVSASGITQTDGSSIFKNLTVNGELKVAGEVTAKAGLKVESSEGLKVSEGPITANNGLTVNGTDGLTVNGTKGLTVADMNACLTVSSGLITATKDLTVNSGKLVVNADLEIVKDKTLTVGGADIVSVPVGGIIMWTKRNLPDNDHWAVCDGTDGTPDLRGRFIVGVGKGYDYGDTGGEAEHKLTREEMPSHSHNYTVYGQKRSVDDGEACNFVNYNDENHKGTRTRTTGATGGDKAHENRPPYYALYYIMRIK